MIINLFALTIYLVGLIFLIRFVIAYIRNRGNLSGDMYYDLVLAALMAIIGMLVV